MANEIPPDLIEMILQVLNMINENDEFFVTLASMMRKLYDALLNAGFTEEQATQIVAGFAAGSRK